jgi:hypothetical protein
MESRVPRPRPPRRLPPLLPRRPPVPPPLVPQMYRQLQDSPLLIAIHPRPPLPPLPDRAALHPPQSELRPSVSQHHHLPRLARRGGPLGPRHGRQPRARVCALGVGLWSAGPRPGLRRRRQHVAGRVPHQRGGDRRFGRQTVQIPEAMTSISRRMVVR